MAAGDLACAVADPHHVGGEVVPALAVDWASERLLEIQLSQHTRVGARLRSGREASRWRHV